MLKRGALRRFFGKKEKRLQKLRQSQKDVSFDELRQVLEDHGFTLDHTTGSHHTFRAVVVDKAIKLVIPFNRPIKTVYVRAALDAIDELNEVKRGEDSEGNGTDDT